MGDGAVSASFKLWTGFSKLENFEFRTLVRSSQQGVSWSIHFVRNRRGTRVADSAHLLHTSQGFGTSNKCPGPGDQWYLSGVLSSLWAEPELSEACG
jgi:hypothetical protein